MGGLPNRQLRIQLELFLTGDVRLEGSKVEDEGALQGFRDLAV